MLLRPPPRIDRRRGSNRRYYAGSIVRGGASNEAVPPSEAAKDLVEIAVVLDNLRRLPAYQHVYTEKRTRVARSTPAIRATYAELPRTERCPRAEPPNYCSQRCRFEA
jgi:hypothetical protein